MGSSYQVMKAIQVVNLIGDLSKEDALKILNHAKEMIQAKPDELFCEKVKETWPEA